MKILEINRSLCIAFKWGFIWFFFDYWIWLTSPCDFITLISLLVLDNKRCFCLTLIQCRWIYLEYDVNNYSLFKSQRIWSQRKCKRNRRILNKLFLRICFNNISMKWMWSKTMINQLKSHNENTVFERKIENRGFFRVIIVTIIKTKEKSLNETRFVRFEQTKGGLKLFFVASEWKTCYWINYVIEMLNKCSYSHTIIIIYLHNIVVIIIKLIKIGLYKKKEARQWKIVRNNVIYHIYIKWGSYIARIKSKCDIIASRSASIYFVTISKANRKKNKL